MPAANFPFPQAVSRCMYCSVLTIVYVPDKQMSVCKFIQIPAHYKIRSAKNTPEDCKN